MSQQKYFNRELSWLSFNHRVLQEAKDISVPLYERIKFLAIFSSNLDEFFRVRVASIRSLLNLKNSAHRKLDFDPAKLLKKINENVNLLQEEYGRIFREEIFPELLKNNVCLINELQVNESQSEYLKDFFMQNLLPLIKPMLIIKKKVVPFLQNKSLYLAVKLLPLKSKTKLKQRSKYAVVEIPGEVSRFILLPKQEEDDKYFIIFLDDIIRMNLSQVFPGYKIENAFSLKLTRDAELYIDDEFSGDLLEKVRKSLSKRKTGVPCRFLYDKETPKDFLKFLKESFELNKDDLIPGGRYHNLNDFFSFPNPYGNKFNYEPMHPLCNYELERNEPLFEAIKVKDYLISFPYQKYQYVTRLLNESASDPFVREIKITLYRVAENSEIIKALIKAANNGKKVTAFVEVKARFDEESNIYWADALKKNGIEVLYSFPGLKVHSKLCLIYREEGIINKYAYLSTGNFNEKTSRIYCDHGLFTSNKNLTSEVEMVFDYLENKKNNLRFNHLLVAKFNMRKEFYRLIDNEIEIAKSGNKAYIILKLNGLEDKKIINKLYEASCAGVKIFILVRGICCLIPGTKNLSENIYAISIVDRFLEHARMFIFHNNGDEKYFLGSADWMSRNLSRRIEVVFPIYDHAIQKDLQNIIQLQLSDNCKSRIINKAQDNLYYRDSSCTIKSQEWTYRYLKRYSDENENNMMGVV